MKKGAIKILLNWGDFVQRTVMSTAIITYLLILAAGVLAYLNDDKILDALGGGEQAGSIVPATFINEIAMVIGLLLVVLFSLVYRRVLDDGLERKLFSILYLIVVTFLLNTSLFFGVGLVVLSNTSLVFDLRIVSMFVVSNLVLSILTYNYLMSWVSSMKRKKSDPKDLAVGSERGMKKSLLILLFVFLAMTPVMVVGIRAGDYVLMGFSIAILIAGYCATLNLNFLTKSIRGVV